MKIFDKKIKKKIQLFNIRLFLLSFIFLLFIGALPGLVYGNDYSLSTVIQNAGWYFIYWSVVALLVCFFSVYQQYRAYARPIAELSEASKQVAAGDFSVYIDPKIAKSNNIYFQHLIADFNQMVHELGSLETMKSDFISNVSHELKTPLTVIQNYAVVLKQGNLSSERTADYLDEIIDASDDLVVTISNILLLSKLENQGITTNMKSVNICRQLADVLFTLERVIDEKQIIIEADLEDTAHVFFDENMLQIVWRNILSNAIKFSNTGGRIDITQTSTKNEIVVVIEDNGIGMDKDTLNHLFDKFYQADTSHSQQGNGLGLALVKSVLELINGSITCTSELNKGSIFTIRIPSQKV